MNKLAIHWYIFVNADNRLKCKKVVRDVSRVLEDTLNDVEIEPYKKADARFKIHATTEISSPSLQDSYFSIMKRVGKLSQAWNVTPASDDPTQDIWGASTPGSISIPGVESIHFNAVSVGKSQAAGA